MNLFRHPERSGGIPLRKRTGNAAGFLNCASLVRNDEQPNEILR